MAGGSACGSPAAGASCAGSGEPMAQPAAVWRGSGRGIMGGAGDRAAGRC